MLSVNMNIQNIKWRHNKLESEPNVGEHSGTLESYLIIPGLTIGISDYFNFNYSQTIGVRSMNWEGVGEDTESYHHRKETSLTDYINSIGGAFGDARFKLRYLYKNVGMKEGFRIYFGFGMLIPSKSVLTKSPFIEPDHRHFSLSDGAYKGLLEFQIFKKKLTNPVFYGLTTNFEIPISDSKYGFMPGTSYSFMSSLIYKFNSKKSYNIVPIGVTFGLSFIGTTEASWNKIPTPNSESKLVIPSIGGTWNTGNGSLSISIQKPIFITGLSGDDDPLNNEVNAIELAFGYRRNLGYLIPWL